MEHAARSMIAICFSFAAAAVNPLAKSSLLPLPLCPLLLPLAEFQFKALNTKLDYARLTEQQRRQQL